jgi:hypothetical protein
MTKDWTKLGFGLAHPKLEGGPLHPYDFLSYFNMADEEVAKAASLYFDYLREHGWVERDLKRMALYIKPTKRKK